MARRNSVEFKVRSPLAYVGSKSILSREIIDFMGEHSTYVEPFAGGLNVLLNKYRSSREIAGDMNSEIIEFYRTLVQHPDAITDRLKPLSYDKESFLRARDSEHATDPIDVAVNTLVKHFMSRSGEGRRFFLPDGGLESRSKSFDSLKLSLVKSATRLRGVEFFRRSAFDLIHEFDSPQTCFYIDPPYLATVGVSSWRYDFELSAFDHLRLLRLLRSCQGQVILSGYPSTVYDDELRDWGRYEFDMVSRSSQTSGEGTGLRITEVVWVKPSWNF